MRSIRRILSGLLILGRANLARPISRGEVRSDRVNQYQVADGVAGPQVEMLPAREPAGPHSLPPRPGAFLASHIKGFLGSIDGVTRSVGRGLGAFMAAKTPGSASPAPASLCRSSASCRNASRRPAPRTKARTATRRADS
jgi:hypothetical protein